MFWMSFLLFLEVLFWRSIRLSCWCLVFSCLLCVVLLFPGIWIVFLSISVFLQVVLPDSGIIWRISFLLFYRFLIWKLSLFFFTNLSSSCRIFLYFFRRAFFLLSSFFNSLLWLLSFFRCESSFLVLPFCPLYFSSISFISFSNFGIWPFNVFILRFSSLCFFY